MIKLFLNQENPASDYVGPCIHLNLSKKLYDYQMICRYSDIKLSHQGETFLVSFEEEDGKISLNSVNP